MKHWHVINTRVRREQDALINLWRQGFEAYLPKYRKRRSHARRVEWVPSPLFPCYLFVCLDLAIDQWRVINSTIGVRAIITHGDQPTPIPDQLIQEIKEREDSQGLVDLVNADTLAPGEKVRVTSGPLIDRIGLFQCRDDSQRVFILMELMGQSVEVRLSKSEIVRADF